MAHTPHPPAGPPVPLKAAALAAVLVAVAASGASCPQYLRGYQYGTLPLPRALPAQPTLGQIIEAVHDNTRRVRTYMAPQATLAVPGVPKLSAQIACEPPRRFRLRAQTSVTGNELDLGSNDELFWLWVRRHEPPVLLFCRHDRYAESDARRLLPLKADWLPELLGLVEFSPDDRHEGPFQLPDGRIEIRSRVAAPDGELVRSTLLDGTTGLVLEQHPAPAGTGSTPVRQRPCRGWWRSPGRQRELSFGSISPRSRPTSPAAIPASSGRCRPTKATNRSILPIRQSGSHRRPAESQGRSRRTYSAPGRGAAPRSAHEASPVPARGPGPPS